MTIKYSYHLTNSAKKDLNEIYEYVYFNLGNPLSAKNLIHKFEKAFESVLIMPFRNPLVIDHKLNQKHIRRLNIGNYNAYYKVIENEIIFLRIVYRKIKMDLIIKQLN